MAALTRNLVKPSSHFDSVAPLAAFGHSSGRCLLEGLRMAGAASATEFA